MDCLPPSFFFNDTATTEIYTLSLHDALPICRHFLHHLGAHVLDRVLELDLLRDGNAVLRDGWITELLVDDNVPALGTEGHLHRLGQLVDAPLEPGAGLDIEL